MTEDPAGPPPALLDYDELAGCASLEALRQLYAARGAQLTGDALLARALSDWHQLTLARAREPRDPPADLPPVEVDDGEVRYAVYGVIHGMVGGSDPDYKAFVDRRVGALPRVLFENGLHHFYPRGDYVVIPDYEVLGALGSLRIGLEVGLFFPILLWELLGDLRRRGRAAEGEPFDYTPAYHALDPEARRGVDPDEPVLPSRLQIELELTRWRRRGWRAALADPLAIVPRSAFMAGFARGHAETRGASQVDMVVGDLHSVEIKRFLEDPQRLGAADLFGAGLAFGRRSPRSYRWAVLRAKTLHLLLAGLGGCLVLLPLLLTCYALALWALG